MKVGDLVRGSKDNLEVQQKSIALIVAKDHPYGAVGRFSIIWISGEIKGGAGRGYVPHKWTENLHYLG